MVFSSTVFLFIFLPLVLFIYYNPVFKGRRYRNIVLLLASLFFYAWGEPVFVFIMCFSIVLNWKLCLIMDSKKGNARRNYMMVLAIYNLGLLFIFKYLSFISQGLGLLINSDKVVLNIALPIGISFFIFETMSYVYDVYYESCAAQKSFLNVALYISMFPQLVAGPIVRYGIVSNDIDNRQENFDDFSQGVYRFIYGLGKKVIISNNIAIVADKAFDLCANNNLSSGMAYVGMFAYMIQLYYDFSGYSDMAVGLGKMFGFQFDENFDYPYMSCSITEYWRRWHISLGTWFRDYVMYPLMRTRLIENIRESVKNKWGRKNAGMVATVMATAIVWLLTGIWHGANWTFVLFGIYHGIFVILPIIFKNQIKNFNDRHTWTNGKMMFLFRIVRTLILVGIGDVLFRADDLTQAIKYYGALLGGGVNDCNKYASFYLWNFKYLFIFGIVGSYPILKLIRSKCGNKIFEILETIFVMCILVLSVSYLIRGTYNPFVYFNF